MKLKVLQALTLAIVLASCGKKDNTIPADTIDITENFQPNTIQLGHHAVKESSVAEIEKLVGEQSNDTLYVTNFFATWCGPCMREIPHFKQYKEMMKGQPVKFQFVSLDPKEDWATEVSDFAVKNQLEKDIFLVDGRNITPEFYSKNFDQWDGSGIPFTLFRKGNQKSEYFGMMTGNELKSQINALMK